jgi:hypothetical protein
VVTVEKDDRLATLIETLDELEQTQEGAEALSSEVVGGSHG